MHLIFCDFPKKFWAWARGGQNGGIWGEIEARLSRLWISRESARLTFVRINMIFTNFHNISTPDPQCSGPGKDWGRRECLFCPNLDFHTCVHQAASETFLSASLSLSFVRWSKKGAPCLHIFTFKESYSLGGRRRPPLRKICVLPESSVRACFYTFDGSQSGWGGEFSRITSQSKV